MPRGRKPTCLCGECNKCKRREYMRTYRAAKAEKAPLFCQKCSRTNDSMDNWCKRCHREYNWVVTAGKSKEEFKMNEFHRARVEKLESRGLQPCSVCSTVRPFKDYRHKLSARHSRDNVCRKCRSKVSKARYKENPERQKEYARRYHHENKDRLKPIKLAWQRNNKIKLKEYANRRRSRKVNAKGCSTDEQLQARVDFYGGCCAYCSDPNAAHIDHVIPLSRGGSNWPSNQRPACQFCNMSKKDKLLSEWQSSRAEALNAGLLLITTDARISNRLKPSPMLAAKILHPS